MRNARTPRSPARFVVPVAILGCFAAAFALYGWGGMGPAEREVIALANVVRFGAYAPSQMPAVEPIVVIGRRDVALPHAQG